MVGWLDDWMLGWCVCVCVCVCLCLCDLLVGWARVCLFVFSVCVCMYACVYFLLVCVCVCVFCLFVWFLIFPPDNITTADPNPIGCSFCGRIICFGGMSVVLVGAHHICSHLSLSL